jgi:hypothetical protein
MKKKILIGFGAVLAVALLAGAVYMGVRLLNTNANGGGLNLPIAGLGGPGGGNANSFQIQMTPAPEMPTAHADLVGQVTSIKDNSIFVSEMSKASGGGTNVVIVGKTISGGSGPSTDSGSPSTNDVSPTPSGPATEVVVSQSTVIYRDTTMDSMPKPQPGSSVSTSVQQVLEPADVSSISADSMVQVWGQKRGDRLIADTIVVMGVAILQTTGGGGGK